MSMKTKIESELELLEKEKQKFNKEIENHKNKTIEELKSIDKKVFVTNINKKTILQKIITILYGKKK